MATFILACPHSLCVTHRCPFIPLSQKQSQTTNHVRCHCPKWHHSVYWALMAVQQDILPESRRAQRECLGVCAQKRQTRGLDYHSLQQTLPQVRGTILKRVTYEVLSESLYMSSTVSVRGVGVLRLKMYGVCWQARRLIDGKEDRWTAQGRWHHRGEHFIQDFLSAMSFVTGDIPSVLFWRDDMEVQ